MEKWTAFESLQGTMMTASGFKASAEKPAEKPATAPAPAPASKVESLFGMSPIDIPETIPEDLVAILSCRRRTGTKGAAAFRTWLTATLEKAGVKVKNDNNNLIVEIARPDKKPNNILFSCHTDTVHNHAESEANQAQALAYDLNFGHVFLDRNAKSAGTCLGADDGAGVYVLLQLIRANVPGLYIFHDAEEVGGLGAKHLARQPSLFAGIDFAVAFDRAGTEDIVVTQGGEMCASVAYGNSLSEAFKGAGLEGMKISHGGTFTDTKVYRYMVRECVNIAVGYSKQHGPMEDLDLPYLLSLIAACIKVDWQNLKPSRTCPKEQTYEGGYGMYGMGTASGGKAKGGSLSPTARGGSPAPKGKKKAVLKPEPADDTFSVDDLSTWQRSDFEDYALNADTDDMARLLIMQQAEIEGLKARIEMLERLV